MKTTAIITRLMSKMLAMAGMALLLTACSDEVVNELQSNDAAFTTNGSGSLENLEQYSYTMPFKVTAEGDWRVEMAFNEGHQICYALPDHGRGPATIKLCVLDNWTDERRTGEMTITDSEHPQHPQMYKLGQKCNLDNGVTRRAAGDSKLVIPDKGNRIYGVGYGYNIYEPAGSGLSLNPIVKIESLKDAGIFAIDGAEMDYHIIECSGNTYRELSNDFKTQASAKGKGFGFEGEINASFHANNFNNSKSDYALNIIEVKKCKAELTNCNRLNLMQEFMCDEAFCNINGLPYDSPTAKRKLNIVAYPSTPDGLYRLVKDYGTHLVLRATLGGKLRFATTIDVSKVTGSYDLKTFAKLSYKGKLGEAGGNINDEFKTSFNSNATAIDTRVTAVGGTVEAANNVTDGKKESIDKWKSTLNEVENCKIVAIDNNVLIPLWELVDDRTAEGQARKQALKDYIELGGLLGRMSEDYRSNENYVCSTVSHIMLDQLPTGIGPESTRVRDVYMSGKHVARLCFEFMPQINKEQPVWIVYPVSENNVKYNIGFWPGDANRKPCRICTTDNSVITEELDDYNAQKHEEIYLSGSNFYVTYKDSAKLSDVTIGETIIRDAYAKAPCWNAESQSEQIYNYPIVKIFGRIWMRKCYNGSLKDLNESVALHGYYTNRIGCGLHFEKYENTYCTNAEEEDHVNEIWRIAQYSDYKNLLNGLKTGGINTPVSVMAAGGSNKDLTGFILTWDGWGSVIRQSSKKMSQVQINGKTYKITDSLPGGTTSSSQSSVRYWAFGKKNLKDENYFDTGYLEFTNGGVVEEHTLYDTTDDLYRIRYAIPVSYQK